MTATPGSFAETPDSARVADERLRSSHSSSQHGELRPDDNAIEQPLNQIAGTVEIATERKTARTTSLADGHSLTRRLA
jgi:hypothetical protein